MPKTNRKQRTVAEIQAILADYDSSSLTQKQFCVYRSVPASTFHVWLAKRRRQNQSLLPAIIPVGPVPSLAPPIEIELPDGKIIRLERGFDRKDLADVLAVLHPC
jgi:hypothetical protein